MGLMNPASSHATLAGALALVLLGVACSSSDSPSPSATVVPGGGGAGGDGGSDGSAAHTGPGVGGGATGGTGGSGGGLHIPSGGSGGQVHGHGGAPGPYMLPAGFTKTESGGWLLGPAVPPGGESGGASGAADCVSEIRGIVRDFKRGDRPGGHPDFETFAGQGETGIVAVMLGADRKPVFVDGPHQFTTTKSNFDQWYRDVPGVNDPFFLSLSVAPSGSTFTFDSEAFFPLDGAGFGDEDLDHNFSFTTEVHTTFTYNGGETFTFTGDDDFWIFVNDTLAIDLGGLHPSQTQTLSLDAAAAQLGIVKGQSYPLDLFHAERHSEGSHFRLDTTLAFTDCGSFVPSDPH